LLTSLLATLMLVAGHEGEGGLPSKAPADVGMSGTRLQRIDRVMASAIKAGGFPGGAVVVGRGGATVLQKGFGYVSWSDRTRVSAGTTLYDLASLTKVVATTTAIMILFDEGKVGLDDRVQQYLPEFTGGAKDDVTVRQLLEHRSGLPAGRDLWRVALSPAEARLAAIRTPLECAPGRCLIYSDLGADMLGFIAESASGMRLDLFLEQRVFAPLAMRETTFRPHWTLRDRIAPTELTPPRGYPLRGEVHDENAFALGGVAGHSGLFSTAMDLAVFAQMMLNRGELGGVRIVSDSAVRLFTTQTESRGSRALGWDTCKEQDGSCGKYLSKRAYGHTGFTGTSMWIDPENDLFIILLTNRVHAARVRRPAKVIADVRADVSDAAALSVRGEDGRLRAMPAVFRSDRALGWNRPLRSRSARSRSRPSGGSTKSVKKKAPAPKAAPARRVASSRD
jgi:CubicO group peptidase (beta-lactamase class C family)